MSSECFVCAAITDQVRKKAIFSSKPSKIVKTVTIACATGVAQCVRIESGRI